MIDRAALAGVEFRAPNPTGVNFALGFISYPLVKLLAGRARDVKWLSWVLALLLVLYFVLVRMKMAG